ncbi:MAG: histidine triad nucleotide-binding protein [Candidatus Limnocylindria bacterium]
MDACLFCRIARGEVPANIVREDDTLVVFRDINPQAPIHLLAIPRRHIASVRELEGPDAGLLGALADALRNAADDEGAASYRLVTNVGPDAGQSVAHLHVHLLAGRRLGWPPG